MGISGIIAAGMENGDLALWDPDKIVVGAESVSPFFLYFPHLLFVGTPSSLGQTNTQVLSALSILVL